MSLRNVIRELQRELNTLGAKPPLTTDGIFGPKTEAALKRELAEAPALATPVTGAFTHIHPIDWMRGELGTKEIPGSKDNPRIRWYHTFSKNIGAKEHPDEVPWCSSILQACGVQCGMEITGNALAASWSKYAGDDTGDWVEEGDIIHVKNGKQNHVTLCNKAFNRRTATSFEGIGGNQGNTVKVSTYRTSSIRAAKKWKPLPGTKTQPPKGIRTDASGDENESTR